MTHRQAVWLMVLVTLMWSIAGVVSRQLESARSFEVTFWRSAFTALSLLVLLPAFQGGFRAFKQIAWRDPALWASAVCWSVMFTAFMLALTLTTVANVLITMALGPLFTALLARIALKTTIAPRTWGAIGAAGVGIAVMYGNQIGQGGGSAVLGSLVALAVPVAAAVQWTLTQHLQASQAAGKRGVDLVPAVMLGAMLSTLYTLPLAMPFSATGGDVAWLGLLGLVQLAIPCALSVICARTLKGPEVSLLALLEILFGIALAWAFANEAPSPATLIGGALVIGALVGNELSGSRQ